MGLGTLKKQGNSHGSHLNITSMMDIFVIILVFLLYNVSFDSESEKVTSGLKLPNSNSSKLYKENKINIAMSLESIKVNNEVVMQLNRGVVPASAVQGDKIVPLFNALNKIKDADEAKRGAEAANNTNASLVMFQADKRIPYKQLDPVMKTAGMAGYPYFWLAVMTETKK
jgi:biopolymer transport protein ExbD